MSTKKKPPEEHPNSSEGRQKDLFDCDGTTNDTTSKRRVNGPPAGQDYWLDGDELLIKRRVERRSKEGDVDTDWIPLRSNLWVSKIAFLDEHGSDAKHWLLSTAANVGTAGGEKRVERRISVSTDEWERPQMWIGRQLGDLPVGVHAGDASHYRYAVDVGSLEVRRGTLFRGYVGWDPTENTWLHPGMAGSGRDDSRFHVEYDEPPGHAVWSHGLPGPADGKALGEAVNLLLGGPEAFRDGFKHVPWALAMGTLRAALGDSGLVLHIWGSTGSYKSSLASAYASLLSVPQGHVWQPPIGWSGSVAGITALLRQIGSVVVLDDFDGVDDFQGRRVRDVYRQASNADVRLRATTSGQVRSGALPLRATIFSTAEKPATQESIVNRIITLEVTGAVLGEHAPPRQDGFVVRLGRAAEGGQLAALGHAYLRWLERQDGGVRAVRAQATKDARRCLADAVEGELPRIGDKVESLLAGWLAFRDFLADKGAASNGQLESWHQEALGSCTTILGETSRAVRASSPAEVFADVIQARLESGTCYLRWPQADVAAAEARKASAESIGDVVDGPVVAFANRIGYDTRLNTRGPCLGEVRGELGRGLEIRVYCSEAAKQMTLNGSYNYTGQMVGQSLSKAGIIQRPSDPITVGRGEERRSERYWAIPAEVLGLQPIIEGGETSDCGVPLFGPP